MHRSETWLRGYLERHHLEFPFWPDENLLVFVVWDHPPYFDLTWANPATFDAAGYAWHEVLDEHGDFVGYDSPLCGRNVFEGLAPTRTTPEHPALLAQLRADPKQVGTIDRTSITRQDGTQVPIEVIELRWTGPLERWFIIARVLTEPVLNGVAHGQATTRGKLTKRAREDLYNVDQHTVLRLTSEPTSFVINGGGKVTPILPIEPPKLLPPMPTITFDNGRFSQSFTQDEFIELYKKLLPPYQPPSEDEQ